MNSRWQRVTKWPAYALICLLSTAYSIANAASPTVVSYANGGMNRGTTTSVDALGNFYVAGSINGFYGLLKYNPQGTLVWTYRNSSKGSSNAVYVDNSGDIFCAGFTVNASNAMDWTTVKLSGQGNELWSRKTGNGQGRAIVSDGSGGIYAGGAIRSGGAGNMDAPFTLMRFANDGTLLWQRAIATGFNDSFDGLASDSGGNAIAVGRVVNMNRDSIDMLIVKLNRQGETIWHSMHGQVSRMQFPNDVALDSAGNAWVTGTVANSANDGLEAPLTLQYSANGNLLRSLNEGGADLALDAQGNVLISDVLEAATLSDRRPSVTKFDGQGNKLWASILTASELGGSPLGSRLALDDAANVYVATTIDTNASNSYDFLIAKLNANGTTLWQHRFNGGNAMTDTVTSLQADTFGNVVATGNSYRACANMPTGSCESINTLVFPRGVIPEATSTLPDQPPSLPAAPANLTASASSSTVTLQWADNASNESGYRIERCAGSRCTNFLPIADAAANTVRFSNVGLALNTSYVYRVRAFNAAGTSGHSNSVAVKTPKR